MIIVLKIISYILGYILGNLIGIKIVDTIDRKREYREYKERIEQINLFAEKRYKIKNFLNLESEENKNENS